jgi:hypothetical protein
VPEPKSDEVEGVLNEAAVEAANENMGTVAAAVAAVEAMGAGPENENGATVEVAGAGANAGTDLVVSVDEAEPNNKAELDIGAGNEN